MPYSPDLAITTLGTSYQRGINFDYTRDVVADAIGEKQMLVMDTMHAPTFQHGLATGEMVATVLRRNDLKPEVVRQGALAGGTHDAGKYREDILEWVTYDGDFGHERRRWVTSEHSKEGAYRLRKWGSRNPDLRLAAFTADHHHDPIPSDYADLGSARYRLGWGLTHLTKICDVLNALACDTSREYIAKREGRELGSEDIYNIIGKVAGKGAVTLCGKKLDVDSYVREVLNLPPKVRGSFAS